MKYILTTPDGRVFEFYVKGAAELFRKVHGGVVTIQQPVKEPLRLVA